MTSGRILALSGGIGGAKLAVGLAGILPAGRLSIVANTADDFRHLGLLVSPDIDTLLYSLAGLNNPDTGWGRGDETWSFMAELERLGMDTWFRIGDRDLAVHVYRTQALRSGKTLSQATAELATRFRVPAEVIPMSDDPVKTIVDTENGPLAFQDYFVRYRCEPVVTGIHREGSGDARPAPAFMNLLRSGKLDGILICPSNPFFSIDPILSLPGVADALSAAAIPVIATTPIVSGAAIKGPTAKIMRELAIPVTPRAIAEHYGGLIDGFILDAADRSAASSVASTGVAVEIADTVMRTPGDRVSLARAAIAFLDRLRSARAAEGGAPEPASHP